LNFRKRIWKLPKKQYRHPYEKLKERRKRYKKRAAAQSAIDSGGKKSKRASNIIGIDYA